jgi:hypothetical protein
VNSLLGVVAVEEEGGGEGGFASLKNYVGQDRFVAPLFASFCTLEMRAPFIPNYAITPQLFVGCMILPGIVFI